MSAGGDRVRAVQERRRSGAAGPHGHRPTRADELTLALADEDDLDVEVTEHEAGTDG